jgi:hypothetical protein
VRAPLLPCSLLVLAVASCAQSPAQDGPTGDSHVESFEWPGGFDARLDVLFVLDDTAASAPYVDRTQALLRDLDTVSSMLPDPPDLHVAVVTAEGDGTFRLAPGVDGPFVIDELAPTWWSRITNHAGTVGDAAAALGAIGTGGTRDVPLAAMRAALEDAGPFRRAGAELAVVIVSASDDASTDPPDAYAAWLRTTVADPNMIAVALVAPPTASRLAAFAEQFPNRASTASIDDASYAPALSLLDALWKTTLEAHCLPQPLDFDPAPGLQADCTIEIVQSDGVIADVPACPGEHCWSYVTDPHNACPEGGGTFRIGPYLDRWPSAIRGQCVVAK